MKHSVEIPYFYGEHDLNDEWTVPEFEGLIRPLVDRALTVAENALAKAGTTADELNGILLAGGTSQIPLVKDLIEQRFGLSPKIVPRELMWLVAKGAAIYHKDLMTRPTDSVKLKLGADLILETFTQGRIQQSVLVQGFQSLPHSFSRVFPVNREMPFLTVQLLSETSSAQDGSIPLARREISTDGLSLSQVLVKVEIDHNKTIKLSVHDPRSGLALDRVSIEGDLLGTPEQIRAVRETYSIKVSAPKASTARRQSCAIGIDLGTTTCEAVIWDTEDRVYQHGLEEPLLSQVLVRPDGRITVDNGDHSAKNEGFFNNFKVDIGQENSSRPYVAFGKRWPPEVLSAHLLATIWAQLQVKYGQVAPLMEAVITVPSDFNPDQSAYVRNAAQIAGIENPILLAEPVAAFLAYAEDFDAVARPDQTFLIFDFGGGTTDVCVVGTKTFKRVEILGSDGNNNIGGKDITEDLASAILDRFVEKQQVLLKKTEREKLGRLLLPVADKAKVALSSALGEG